MECDVIVTYCWNRVGYNIIRSLSGKGLRVVVGDTSSYNICSMSKYSLAHFVYADPFKQEDAFIADIKKAIDFYHPKVVMPTHDEGVVLARHRNELPQSVVFCMESYEKQMSLSDKYEATKIAESVGVPIPKLLDGLEGNVEYPIVVKTRIGNSAKGVFFPKSKKEATELMCQYKMDDILLEEFFVGRDYSVDCVRYDDFFVATTYKSLVTKTDGGGTTTQRILVSMPSLEEYARKILDKVDYHGVCGMDFKVNEDTHAAAFIEVNTRFTGGLATPMTAGFDIPYIVYALFEGIDFDRNICPRFGTKTKWILGDVIALVTKIIGRTLTKDELKRIISWNFDAYDDFRKDDKKAILGEMGYYLIKLLKNRKLNP